jgi:hypothetical protein
MGEENTYRCPSWDKPITEDEIRRIEADNGPLANTLAELAQLIREMDRAAPKIISLKDRIKVVVEPTAGAMGLRVEEWEIGNVADDLANGLGVETDLVAWESRETVGFLIRILASVRKLRPQIGLVIGEGEAGDFYVDLHRTLDYVEHNCGKGLVIRMCMQWRGVDGSAKKFADKVKHWQTNFVNLAKEELQPLVPRYVEIDYAQRTLTVGEVVITPPDRVWAFLKGLADVKRHNLPDLRCDEWKNAVDMLRRKVGKGNLQFVVDLNRRGYRLAQNVKLKGFGQVGIGRRTR